MTKKCTLKSRMFCALMIALSLALSACGAAMNDTAMTEVYDDKADSYSNKYSYSASYDAETAAPGEVYDDIAAEKTATADEPTLAPDSARKLIKTVSMHMETKTFDAFLQELYDRIETVDGYIQSSSVNGSAYSVKYAYARSAYITARIPADRLDFFCDGVAGVANVISRTEETSDVTLKYYDTESHMKALQSEYETLVGILEKCTKLEDVISVQQRITDVLYQIESYKTTLNNYDNLVAYSTVTMRIEEVKEETVVTEQTLGERILSGVKRTFSDLRVWAEDSLVGFVAFLPYLLIWAAILFVAFFVVRGAVRRIRKKRAQKRAKIAVPLAHTETNTGTDTETNQSEKE